MNNISSPLNASQRIEGFQVYSFITNVHSKQIEIDELKEEYNAKENIEFNKGR